VNVLSKASLKALSKKGSLAMREPGPIILSLSLGFSLLLPLSARGQDAAPSLGDVARKTRQQKQSDEPQAQPLKPAIVINDEDGAPQGSGRGQISVVGNQHHSSGAPASKNGRKPTAEQWKAAILAQKNLIHSTQTSMDQLAQSIHFLSPSQVRWNERQREKQQQLERLQAQLQDQQKRLEAMQEEARREGYGSVVYDP
jgi:hypothetical protein